jgi:hypothetical protein
MDGGENGSRGRPRPRGRAVGATPAQSRNYQIPPDLVVKFQAIDIAEVILWLGLRLRVVYQQEIKG